MSMPGEMCSLITMCEFFSSYLQNQAGYHKLIACLLQFKYKSHAAVRSDHISSNFMVGQVNIYPPPHRSLVYIFFLCLYVLQRAFFYFLCTVSGCDGGNQTRNIAVYTWRGAGGVGRGGGRGILFLRQYSWSWVMHCLLTMSRT
jgi:hypothetical protein